MAEVPERGLQCSALAGAPHKVQLSPVPYPVKPRYQLAWFELAEQRKVAVVLAHASAILRSTIRINQDR